MGPYCNYCDHRCFVPNPRKPGHLLATCHHGQEHDHDTLGYNYRSVTESEAGATAITRPRSPL